MIILFKNINLLFKWNYFKISVQNYFFLSLFFFFAAKSVETQIDFFFYFQKLVSLLKRKLKEKYFIILYYIRNVYQNLQEKKCKLVIKIRVTFANI